MLSVNSGEKSSISLGIVNMFLPRAFIPGPSFPMKLNGYPWQGTATAPVLEGGAQLLYLPLQHPEGPSSGATGSSASNAPAVPHLSRGTAVKLLKRLLDSGKPLICFDIQSGRCL